MQSLVSWDLHDISTHQLMIFDEHTQLCLHWSYAHLCAGVTGHICCWGPSAHQSHRAELRSVLHHQLMMFCEQDLSFISAIRSKCHLDVLALIFWTSERCTYFQATSVIRLVCQVRWSSGCWAWICNSHHQLMTSDQHTQLCLHWCNARLSTVVEVGTCAAAVPMHNSHKVCIITWSVDWLCAAYSWSTHNAFWPCCRNHKPQMQQASPTCACIDVLHIWALYSNWAHLLWLQCTSVTRSICIIRFSNDWSAGLGSRFHHQLMMFHEQNVRVSGHHTQQVSPTCACSDVLHIWALNFRRICCGCSAHQSRGLSVLSDSAVIDGWAGQQRSDSSVGLVCFRADYGWQDVRSDSGRTRTRSANKDVQLILEKHWSYYAIKSCIANISLN